MKFIFLNWKAEVDYSSVVRLANILREYQDRISRGNQLVVLPPGVFLLTVSQIFEHSPILVGAQDISSFESGPYTGETTIRMIAPYARFCLLGHSERRRYFHESGRLVNQKIGLCQKHRITPVVCVSGPDQLADLLIPSGLEEVFISYESPAYIGGEKALDPSQIKDFSQRVASSPALSSAKFIYGGSVTENNISSILGQPEVSGVLVGHASCEPERLKQIISLLI